MPSLNQVKSNMQNIVEALNWQGANAAELTMLLAEEVGEVAKEVRQLHFKTGKEDTQKLAHELADVLNYVVRLAHTYNIDLDKAIEEKQQIIRERHGL